MRLAIVVLPFINSLVAKDHNGGTDCFACVAGVSLIRQYAHKLDTTGSEALYAFCNLQTPAVKAACNAGVAYLSKKYDLDEITSTEDSMTPDDLCREIGICYTEENRRECNLFPKIHGNKQVNLGIKKTPIAREFEKICSGKNKLFCAAIKRILLPVAGDGVADHLPQFDADGDGFSGQTSTLRGWHWRGYDCEDSRIKKTSEVYPGRRAEISDWDEKSDTNCNGIFGKDNDGNSYEEKFCKENPGLGFSVLGDSASAHFHLPQKIFSPFDWDESVFEHLPIIAENEGDFPMTSWGAGIEDVSPKWTQDFTQTENLPETKSIYLRMREWNRCSHNDYQNNGVNGGDSNNMKNIRPAFRRNNSTDIIRLDYNTVLIHPFL